MPYGCLNFCFFEFLLKINSIDLVEVEVGRWLTRLVLYHKHNCFNSNSRFEGGGSETKGEVEFFRFSIFLSYYLLLFFLLTQGERNNNHRNLVAQLEDENLAPTQKGLEIFSGLTLTQWRLLKNAQKMTTLHSLDCGNLHLSRWFSLDAVIKIFSNQVPPQALPMLQ